MKTIYATQEEFECDHYHAAIAYRIDSAKRRYYVMQCLACSQQVGSAIKTPEITSDIPAFDEESRDRWWKNRQIRQREIASEQWADKRRSYHKYLNTGEWRGKSCQVLKRDKSICQAQLQGCTIHATQAHHTTYKHIYQEPLWELVAVCQHCHEIITKMDRELMPWLVN